MIKKRKKVRNEQHDELMTSNSDDYCSNMSKIYVIMIYYIVTVVTDAVMQWWICWSMPGFHDKWLMLLGSFTICSYLLHTHERLHYLCKKTFNLISCWYVVAWQNMRIYTMLRLVCIWMQLNCVVEPCMCAFVAMVPMRCMKQRRRRALRTKETWGNHLNENIHLHFWAPKRSWSPRVECK